MGTLDEAIREHLELKRRQGVGEDELRKAESEAFGPGEDDDVPGASITAPAGEGDQLDKVFSGGPPDDAPPTTVIAPEEVPSEAGESRPEAEAVVEVEEEAGASEAEEPAAAVEATEVVEVEESPTPAPAEPVEVDPEPQGDQADASDLLEAERANLTGHPTENYDVDAAIAEEQELDILSEGRLSEELDRALGGADPGIPEGLGAGSEEEQSAEFVEGGADELDLVEDVEATDETPATQAEEPIGEAGPDESGETSPLEETPDFLEDSPTSDELWFEQGEPKDFDFGD